MGFKFSMCTSVYLVAVKEKNSKLFPKCNDTIPICIKLWTFFLILINLLNLSVFNFLGRWVGFSQIYIYMYICTCTLHSYILFKLIIILNWNICDSRKTHLIVEMKIVYHNFLQELCVIKFFNEKNRRKVTRKQKKKPKPKFF